MPAARLAHWAGVLADFVFPRLCCGCGERVIESGRLICSGCEKTFRPLLLPICSLCGAENAIVGPKGKCPTCPAGKVHFETARGVVAFEGVAHELVVRLKYNRRTEYAAEMGRLLRANYSRDFPGFTPDLLIPVPLFGARQRERGFNQSELLAHELAVTVGCSVNSKALRRIRPTRTQTKLSRTQRAENIRGAFAVADAGTVQNHKVLLVDDVYTTGATLNECARMLMEAGAESVNCHAFARTCDEI
ncbi:MAG: ComF family protein [Candidatus Sumerlaeaceae bacterium]|nr:ComF family protein [Candidatus Sumerlaeaceae bacterium]